MTFTLGLDLSLTSTGWAMWNDDGTFEHGTIKTVAASAMGQRLSTIVARVTTMVSWGPALVLVEDQVMRSQTAGITGQVHGAVTFALWGMASTPPVVRLPPSTLKKFATGKGNAPKDLMLAEAIKRLGYGGHQNDEVDALWLAAAGAHLCGLTTLPVLPQAHVAALKDYRLEVAA